MKKNTQVKAITIALIVSALFLVVGVDYLPHLICWLPLIISATFACSSSAFVAHVTRWLDRVIPID